MVWRCVAAGCSLTYKHGVSLFHFPKDPALKKKWIDQVRRTRDKWEPTDNSVLCSKHFEDDCFELDSKFAKAMGLKRKVRLRPNASPTLFEKPASLKRKSSASEMSAPKRRKGAFEKRERSRVSNMNLIIQNFM